jgi:hypothetical protein
VLPEGSSGKPQPATSARARVGKVIDISAFRGNAVAIELDALEPRW